MLHSAGWQCCLINVVDGDPFPYTHSGAPRGPAVGPLIFFSCHDAHICKLYGSLLKLRSSSPSAMNAMLCDKEARQCEIILLFLKLCFLFLFAAYAVIANGQVECSKGFKRMNLTHCQGKLYSMFSNVYVVQYSLNVII